MTFYKLMVEMRTSVGNNRSWLKCVPEEDLHKIIGRYTMRQGVPTDLKSNIPGRTDLYWFKEWSNGQWMETEISFRIASSEEVKSAGENGGFISLKPKETKKVEEPVPEPMRAFVENGLLKKER